MNSSGVKILYLVQTFHTRLPYVMSSIIPNLPAEHTWVVLDKHGRGSWYTQLGCWKLASLLSGYTHVCFLQDDIELCLYFSEVLPSAVSAKPDVFIGLWFSQMVAELSPSQATQVLDLLKSGRHWFHPRFFVAGPGTVVPYHVVSGMQEWAQGQDRKNWPDIRVKAEFLNSVPGKENSAKFEHMDDVRVTLYRKKLKIPVWVTLPHLIDHLGGESICTPGFRDSRHVSFCFLKNADLRNADWSR